MSSHEHSVKFVETPELGTTVLDSAPEQPVSTMKANPAVKPSKDKNEEYLATFKRELHGSIADAVRLRSTKSRRRFNREQKRIVQKLRAWALDLDDFFYAVVRTAVRRDEGVPKEVREAFMTGLTASLSAIPQAEPQPLSASFWREHQNYRGDWAELYQPYLDLEADRLSQAILDLLWRAYYAGLIGRTNWVDDETMELSFVDYEFRKSIDERNVTEHTLGWRDAVNKYQRPGKHGWFTQDIAREEHIRGRAELVECRHIHTLISVKTYRPTLSHLPARVEALWDEAPALLKPFCQVITGDVTNDPTPLRFLLDTQTFERTERSIASGPERFLHDPVLTLGNTFVLAGWAPTESPTGLGARLGRLFALPLSSR
jgi:hypothetical protein